MTGCELLLVHIFCAIFCILYSAMAVLFKKDIYLLVAGSALMGFIASTSPTANIEISITATFLLILSSAISALAAMLLPYLTEDLSNWWERRNALRCKRQ